MKLHSSEISLIGIEEKKSHCNLRGQRENILTLRFLTGGSDT